ncbi:acetyltransferase (GNAT) family protein [Pontibacter ummariensis]|uniref:Acetyltransferase (GNAT) domain-containing protein n=1 Tax=Pontibacter ummariensis TaxID=1610492 RepID=A0A239IJ47_9BACT|nr:GNAT family N-acetyltransferase [Pontibacter ummariensis]PRY09880.1 acetyltransferase (GNAT) family protein [Pontibacter ummariensis]SNS93786.1 Acetyltransferase (GNAT) domain-containing protein [Pontibacter ummariensis]
MKIITPATAEDFNKYYRLRYETLRQPWGQPEGSEKVEDDETAVHAMLVNDAGEAIGICRLHLNTPEEGQLRFMGIRQDQQGKALGNLLMEHLEAKAREMGANRMMLHAREYAVNFYRRNGYEVEEESYLLFGTIQHYKMAKQL